MSLIGIIPNPSSGKDIRRLVSEASGMDNREKVNIVRRVLRGIDVLGVERVLIMPDPYGIGHFAMDRLSIATPVDLLEMEVFSTPNDSRRAAARMCEMGATCLVVLGGDGTNRMVAQVSGDVPVLPISTGTNNVWPQPTEGTLAGMAAAVVAKRLLPLEAVSDCTNRLEICIGSMDRDEREDIALVDVAAYDGNITGSRAVWKTEYIRELVLSSAQTGTLGLSSIGAAFATSDKPNAGLYLRMGPGGKTVMAPIAPGIVNAISIQQVRWIEVGESVELATSPCVIAVDGERETVVREQDRVSVKLARQGPLKVNVSKTLQAAADRGLFVTNHDDSSC